MNEYEGNWISTLHVPHFHFLSPAPEEIDIRDIAHALAMTCRYGGHCNRFYSVAEHSVRMSYLVDERSRLSALLHDAEEAYLPDIPRPIKNRMPEAKEIYLALEEAILSKFDAFGADWKLIKEMDNRLLLTEAEKLGVYNKEWVELGELVETPLPLGWSWQEAEEKYLRRFEELYGRASTI